MKFLVTRYDVIKGRQSAMSPKSSSFWPVIVDAESHEDALRAAYTRFPDWNGNLPLDRPFLVVAMQDACVVELKPKKDYETIVTPAYFD